MCVWGGGGGGYQSPILNLIKFNSNAPCSFMSHVQYPIKDVLMSHVKRKSETLQFMSLIVTELDIECPFVKWPCGLVEFKGQGSH